MADNFAIKWDQDGKRQFETGTDRGVLYVMSDNAYGDGVAWNGLTAVTESPSGAEANPIYADNIKYAELRSAEEFGATIEAYTYPDEFAQCDGSAEIANGVYIGQQGRSKFGFTYRTKVGNDLDTAADTDYKLHIVYGCTASPSEKAYQTVNDSPEAITFSWEITTTPVPVPGFKPTAIITLQKSKVDGAKLTQLETILYGKPADSTASPAVEEVKGRLPMPSEIIDLF
jgi:hypothetical protein